MSYFSPHDCSCVKRLSHITVAIFCVLSTSCLIVYGFNTFGNGPVIVLSYTELLLYCKSALSVLDTKKAGNTRLRPKTLSIMFLVVVSFVLVDVVVSSLVDIYRDFSSSKAGMSLFVSVIGVLGVGTYAILRMSGEKIRGTSRKATYENKASIGV